MKNPVLIAIARKLVGIAHEDLTKAERQIFDILYQEWIVELDAYGIVIESP